MLILVEADTPDYCYLSEAIEWVAFGRLPIAHNDKHGEDSRFASIEGLLTQPNAPPPHRSWITESEAQCHNVSYSSEYQDAVTEMPEWDPYEKLQKVRREIEELPDRKEELARLDTALKQIEQRKRTVTDFESQFEYVWDNAWAQVYQKVAAGLLLIEGRSKEDYDKYLESLSPGQKLSGFMEATPFQPIDPKEIPLMMDWRSNQTPAKNGWYSLRTRLNEVIGITPLGEPRPLHVTRFGSSFIVDNDRAVGNVSKRLGRPPAADWKELSDYVLAKHAAGESLPNEDKAAYDVIAYVESTGKKAPSVSSVKRNLAAVFKVCIR